MKMDWSIPGDTWLEKLRTAILAVLFTMWTAGVIAVVIMYALGWIK